MALAVVTSIALQVGTPHRGRVKEWWVFPLVEIVLLVVLVILDPGRIDRRTAATRVVTMALIILMTVGTFVAITVLAVDIINNEGVDSIALLGRGAAVWFTNVIVFSLWYWELDRGGAAERAAGSHVPPAFAFPENATPELAPDGWIPRYADYLYLAFTNATAFSPTDTLPVRVWAKMMMMAQAAVSLVTAILVIARAINGL